MQAEGHPVAMKRDTKEGLSTWVCGYSLLAGGQGNEEKVYDYINAFLDDDTAEYLVTEWGYGHANQAAMERIDQETLASMDYDNLERSEKHTSELQSLMRISYAVICLKKKNNHIATHINNIDSSNEYRKITSTKPAQQLIYI